MLKQLTQVLWGIHLCLAVLWIYQGLVPKLIYHAADEQYLWQAQGVDEMVMLFMIEISGYIEIIFGSLFLVLRQAKILHMLNIIGMVALSLLICVTDLRYFQQAFNPFVMNVAMAMLSIVALQLLHIKHQLQFKHTETLL